MRRFCAKRFFLLDRPLRSRWRLCRLRMRRTPCGCGPFVSGLSAAAHAAVGLRHAPAGAVFSARTKREWGVDCQAIIMAHAPVPSDAPHRAAKRRPSHPLWGDRKRGQTTSALPHFQGIRKRIHSSSLTIAICSSSSCFCVIPMRRGRMGAPEFEKAGQAEPVRPKVLLRKTLERAHARRAAGVLRGHAVEVRTLD